MGAVRSRSFRYRILGPQRLPQSIWVDTRDDALGLIGKRREAERFAELLALTRSRQPALLEWVGKRPLQAIELVPRWPRWPRLLAVVDWLAAHLRPGIYLRQVDIPGVHSKFIEAYRGVLAELLDLALPAGAIAADRSGVGQFAARYGFLDRCRRWM